MSISDTDSPSTLPSVPIPLRPEDPEVELDLQAVLNHVYDRAVSDMAIDSRSDPTHLIKIERAAWADRLLGGSGRQTRG